MNIKCSKNKTCATKRQKKEIRKQISKFLNLGPQKEGGVKHETPAGISQSDFVVVDVALALADVVVVWFEPPFPLPFPLFPLPFPGAAFVVDMVVVAVMVLVVEH